MKRTDVRTEIARGVLGSVLLSGAGGCDLEVTAELAALSGAYLGDTVSVLATAYLHDALGLEAGGATHEHTDDEHAHEAEPLHDHEH